MKHFRIKQTSTTELKITGSNSTTQPQRSQQQQQEEPNDASGSDVRIKKTSKPAGLSIARGAPSTSELIPEDRRNKKPSTTGLSIARTASSTGELTAKGKQSKNSAETAGLSIARTASSINELTAKDTQNKKRKSAGGIGIAGTSGTRGSAAEQEGSKGGGGGGRHSSNEPHEKGGISIWGTASPQKKKQKTNQLQVMKEPSGVERATKRRSLFGYQMQRVLQQSVSQEHVDASASNAAQGSEANGISIANASNDTGDEDGEIHMGVEIKSLSKKKPRRKPNT